MKKLIFIKLFLLGLFTNALADIKIVKIPTLTNQTTLDASPAPMVNPVMNRTGEIMGKATQQVGAVMYRVQKRQETVQNINLSRQFNANLITFQGDFEANEDLSNPNSLAKYDEQIDSKINDIINNYQGSDDSKQKLITKLQGQASTYRAKTQVKIRNKQIENVYDHINDGLSLILQDITEGNIDIEKGLQQAFNNINDYGKELGTNQKLNIYDAFRSKVGIGKMEKFIQTGQIERGMNFLNDPKNKLIIDAMPTNKRQSYQIRFNSLYEKSLYDNKNQKIRTKEKTESMLKTFSQNKETAILALITAVGDTQKASEYKTSSPQQRKKILNEMIKQGMSGDFDWTATGWGSDVMEWLGFQDPVELESILSRLKATNTIKSLTEIETKLTPLLDSDTKLASQMQGDLNKRAPREMFRNLVKLISHYENMESKLKTDYNLKYGSLPKQSITQKTMTYNVDNNRPAIYDNNGNKMKIYNVDNDGNVTVE